MKCIRCGVELNRDNGVFIHPEVCGEGISGVIEKGNAIELIPIDLCRKCYNNDEEEAYTLEYQCIRMPSYRLLDILKYKLLGDYAIATIGIYEATAIKKDIVI